MSRQSGRTQLTDFFFKPAIPKEGVLPPIFFEAHILGVSDSSAAQWDAKMDMGRADPTYFYQSHQRTVGISFACFAMNQIEHVENYENLKQLKNLTLPIYASGLGRYNAPHCVFKIGKLLSGYAIINTVDTNWTAEVTWYDEKPIYTEVDVSLTVIANAEGKRVDYSNGNYNYFGV